MINKNNILGYLHSETAVYTYDVIPSTNDEAKRFLLNNSCDKAVFIARGQTAGKGRHGRSFYSPIDTGIYMTYVFTIDKLCPDIVRVTTVASVAVAKALDCGVKIKWVNDLYLGRKKICGILTEIIKSAERNYVMIGIGVNLTTTDFPEEIRNKAGSIRTEIDINKMIAAICDNLSQIAAAPFASDYLEYYRKNMLGIGEMISYSENGVIHTAKIEGINEYGELLVMEEFAQKRLCSGDITIESIESIKHTECMME